MRQGMIAIYASLLLVLGCQTYNRELSPAPSKVQQLSGRAPSSQLSPLASEGTSKAKQLDGLPLDGTGTLGPVELTEKEKVFFELSGEKITQLTEPEIYRKSVEKYRQNDEIALNAYVNLMLKKYPRSIYCDNVLYLQGMLSFSQKKFGESLNSFQKILNVYPHGNKAVSALFAKGVVFKKMNLNQEAIRLLAQVVNQYPGSPESARAQVELKLMTQ